MKQPLMPFSGPAGRVPCRGLGPGDRFSRILLDLAIWRGLLSLGEPFRRVLALLLFLARSSLTLAGDCKRAVWQAVGWLSAPPRTPLFRKLGYGFAGARRWHLALGESHSDVASCAPSISGCQQGLTIRAWACAASIVVFAVVRELLRRLREASEESLLQIRACTRRMSGATTWKEWSEAAEQLDALQAARGSRGSTDQWKRETRLYDRKLLDQRLRHLKAVRARGDVSEMMFAVRADLLRNLGNMTNRCTLQPAHTSWLLTYHGLLSGTSCKAMQSP